MNYTAEHIDPEKFEAALDNHKRYQEELQRTAIEAANARYEGYCKCLEDVRGMLHCSNYEKTSKVEVTEEDKRVSQKEKDFANGVNAAFSWLGERLGIQIDDIIKMDVGVETKSEVMVQRIALFFKEND